MTTVTKNDLVRHVSESTGCKNKVAQDAVGALFTVMRENLIEGNRIEVRGFGVLTVRNYKANPAARNPRTGEIIHVPARRKIHFNPALLLKQAMHEPQ